MSVPPEKYASASFTREFSNTFSINDTDWYFDDLLLAYKKLGGTLNNLEKERLQTLGYLGDPQKRLAELLASEK